MMNKGMIVALEGKCGAGKTSVLRKIENFIDNFIILKEVPVVTPCPLPLDLLNSKICLKRSAWYLKQEIKRSKLALKFKNEGKIVGTDRNYISVLSFSLSNFLLNDDNSFFDTLKFFYKVRNKLVRPDIYIFLSISSRKSKQRYIKRERKKHPAFANEKFLDTMEKSTKAIAKILEPEVPFYVLDVHRKNLNDITEKVKDIIIK